MYSRKEEKYIIDILIKIYKLKNNIEIATKKNNENKISKLNFFLQMIKCIVQKITKKKNI